MDVVNIVSSQDGFSSLMAVSQDGRVEMVVKLLQHGARVDLQTQVINIQICNYTYVFV